MAQGCGGASGLETVPEKHSLKLKDRFEMPINGVTHYRQSIIQKDPDRMVEYFRSFEPSHKAWRSIGRHLYMNHGKFAFTLIRCSNIPFTNV